MPIYTTLYKKGKLRKIMQMKKYKNCLFYNTEKML